MLQKGEKTLLFVASCFVLVHNRLLILRVFIFVTVVLKGGKTGSGRRSRRFESSHPDHELTEKALKIQGLFCFVPYGAENLAQQASSGLRAILGGVSAVLLDLDSHALAIPVFGASRPRLLFCHVLFVWRGSVCGVACAGEMRRLYSCDA